MTTHIGILSDTHLSGNSELFQGQVNAAFSSCASIIHAGDLTDHAILAAFGDREVHAVHGNMCTNPTRNLLPESLLLSIEGVTVAVCHGAGLRHNAEQRLFERFHEADCIVYGHTHQSANHVFSGVLFVNPGSFQATSNYGHRGTYAILTVDQDRLSAAIHALPEIR